jgi:MFS family permease
MGRPERGASWFGRSLLGLALASFLSDVGHELATASLPLYVASIGLGAAALGAIEGFADLASGLAKLGGGAAGQVLRRKKPVAAFCYLATGIGTAATGLVRAPGALASLRAFAWAARGFRGPLRDFLVADAVEPTHYGRAYGVERAGDMAGAVVGPLLAAGLLGAGVGLDQALFLTAVPAVLAAASLAFFVREKGEPEARGRPRNQPPRRQRLPREFWPLLGAVLVFGLGDFSRTFLILAAARALTASPGLPEGFGPPAVPVVLYAVHNAVSALVSVPAGRLADGVGRGPVLAAGYAVGALTSFVLAIGSGSLAAVVLAFVLSGAYVAVEETVERALVAESLPREVRSRGLGLLAATNALGDLVSSVYVGLLWERAGGGVAFGTAGAVASLGWLALVAAERFRKKAAAAS